MTENNQYKKLKVELDKIRADYNRATTTLRNVKVFGVQDFAIKFEKWKQELLNEENGVDAIWGWIKNNEELSKNSSNISKELVEKIRENLLTVKENIKSMQTAYENFLIIQGKITESEKNIDNLSNNAKQLKNDIDGIKNQSQGILDEVKNLFQKAQKQIGNMQIAYEEFLKIKGKIEDEDTGLNAIFSDVQNIQKKSQNIYTEIQSFRDESSNLLDNIKNNKEESDNLKEKIDTIFKNSKDTTKKNIEEIKKITALITDTGFANSFHAQSKKLNIGRIIWGVIFVISTILLAIFLYILFTNSSNNGSALIALDFGSVLYRLSLTSPLLFLIGFSIKQYSRETNLNDKYEFKATTASSISHHIKFLKDEFTGKEDEILEFAKDTFIKIYKEPYEIKDDKKIKKLKKKIEDLSKNITNKKENNIDINNLIKSTKELKELFPDEDLFKKVIEFTTKLLKN